MHQQQSTFLRKHPNLTEHARREFSKIIERGHGDVCAEFGASFAAWVEVSWLNLTDDTAPKLATTAAAWINAWRLQNKTETIAQSEKLYDIARKLFAERRQSPLDPVQDPASSLLLEKVPDGQPLTDELLMYDPIHRIFDFVHLMFILASS